MALLHSRGIASSLSSASLVCRCCPSASARVFAAARGWNNGSRVTCSEVSKPLGPQERSYCAGAAARDVAAEGFGLPEKEDKELKAEGVSQGAPSESLKLSLVPSQKFESLSQDAAMGLVLHAAAGKGWTTGSGLEGPAIPESAGVGKEGGSADLWPSLGRHPRRRMRVAFTCNVCGHRTTRAINPHAYTDGTVFVQCGGCDVFHKLVDNLNLFHELKGRVFDNYEAPGFAFHEPFEYLKFDEYL